jgi:hypothetical protein
MNESLLPASNTPTPNKLYWSTQITLFNKSYTTDYFNQPNGGMEGVSGGEVGMGVEGESESESESEEVKSVQHSNSNSNSVNNNNNAPRGVVQFSNKRTARNDLAVSILKEIDIRAYEEMLTGQQNVRKTLQTYRDGVISG